MVVVAKVPGCRYRVPLHILYDTAGTLHRSLLATAIDLIDHGAPLEVDLGVFCPGVRAEAGTIDRSHIAFRLVRPHL